MHGCVLASPVRACTLQQQNQHQMLSKPEQDQPVGWPNDHLEPGQARVALKVAEQISAK